MKKWSDQQLEIFDAMSAPAGNVMVRARAGAGKTTTVIAGLEYAPPGGKLLVAYNRVVAAELRKRAPADVDVRTLHSLGLAMVAQNFGDVRVDQDKGLRIAQAVAHQLPPPQTEEQRAARRSFPHRLRTYVGLAKNVQPTSTEQLRRTLIEKVWEPACDIDELVRLVRACLTQAALDTQTVDFDDMVYFPRRFGMAMAPYSLVVVDEWQDMSPGQLWLVMQAGRRVVGVGDERQAIYSWRGADKNAMQHAVDTLDAEVLPLSTTYRCGYNIVEHVRTTFPDLSDFRAAPGAAPGDVETVAEQSLNPQPGDFVLSRKNALLVPHALDCAKRGVPICVTGFNLAKQIKTLVDMSLASTTRELRTWARERKAKEVNLLREQDREDLIPSVVDRFDTLVAMSFGVNAMSQMMVKVRKLVTDEPTPGTVTFSSVHRAKGHERERVWVLEDSLRPLGYSDEEDNIRYVAATRAKHELLYVKD